MQSWAGFAAKTGHCELHVLGEHVFREQKEAKETTDVNIPEILAIRTVISQFLPLHLVMFSSDDSRRGISQRSRIFVVTISGTLNSRVNSAEVPVLFKDYILAKMRRKCLYKSDGGQSIKGGGPGGVAMPAIFCPFDL
uniref:Uncharacterized protein n=1 Tax=Steinernema glaseri TaxID=37863 RepID=A0A1I7ZMT2_9BILA